MSCLMQSRWKGRKLDIGLSGRKDRLHCYVVQPVPYYLVKSSRILSMIFFAVYREIPILFKS